MNGSYRERHNRGFGYGGFRRIQRVHARRSGIAIQIDESMKAPIARSPQQWLKKPNHFDALGVDTKRTRQESDKKNKKQITPKRAVVATLSNS